MCCVSSERAVCDRGLRSSDRKWTPFKHFDWEKWECEKVSSEKYFAFFHLVVSVVSVYRTPNREQKQRGWMERSKQLSGAGHEEEDWGSGLLLVPASDTTHISEWHERENFSLSFSANFLVETSYFCFFLVSLQRNHQKEDEEPFTLEHRTFSHCFHSIMCLRCEQFFTKINSRFIQS